VVIVAPNIVNKIKLKGPTMDKTDLVLLQSVFNSTVESLKSEISEDHHEDLVNIQTIANQFASLINEVFDFQINLQDIAKKIKDPNSHTYNTTKIILDNLNQILEAN
jgi:hypothetical protein